MLYSFHLLNHGEVLLLEQSKKSPTGPTEWTPKPVYLVAPSQLTERGPLGFGPIQFLMETTTPDTQVRNDFCAV